MRVPAVDRSYEEFMAHAYGIELEAAERYAQFADQLETHNNPEVAKLFRKLAEIEALHAKHILSEMGWPSVPAVPPAFAADTEGPETAPFDSLHYLMQPYHALEIALRCELQAVRFFDEIAASAAPARIRKAAAELAADEREHVKLVRDWLKRVPQPGPAWDHDPDPPQVNE
jgi:rubrerythrin